MILGYRAQGIGNRESGNLKTENGKLKDMINTTEEDTRKLSFEKKNKRLATGEYKDGKLVAEGDVIRSKPSSVEQTLSQANTKNTPFFTVAKEGGVQASDRRSASRKGGCLRSRQGDFNNPLISNLFSLISKVLPLTITVAGGIF